MKRCTPLLLILFVALVAGCGARETPPPADAPSPPANNAAQPMNTPVPPPTPAPATTAEPSGSACTAGESNRESPLYDHQVYLAGSADGLQLAGPGALILEHASVPDGVIGPDGRLWVYFVNGEPGRHGIFAARQTDGGAWEVVDCVKLDGRFEGNAVDPDVTRLPDGRYRLVYFLGSFVGGPPPDPGQLHPIYSAISEDGINFTVERQLIAVENVTDPSLAQLPDGRWLLALAHNGETLLAASDDGDNFALTGVAINAPGIPELAALPDGRIALYLNQIWLSADGGQSWTAVEGSHVPGGGADPSLVALPDGGYAFFYKGFGSNPPGQPDNPLPEQSPAPPPGAADPGAAMYSLMSDPLDQEAYLAQVNAETGPQSGWQYQTTLIAAMPAGEKYDVGGFCRLFPRPDGGYDVIFGGSFNTREVTETRRYEGDVYRRLGDDLTFQSEPELFSPRGGDLAVDSDGQFYYLLTSHPQGWTLGKYDLDFNLVKEVVVPLPEGHAANDQMLRVWDGTLYLSGLYNPNYASTQPGQKPSPDEAVYTRLWLYDADLNPLADYVLDDAANINGGTLIPYDDGFAYVAADNFVTNNLYAHLYDAAGNYRESILLAENAQWSMGGALADGKIYLAYHRGQHESGDVILDVYDLDWNRLERIEVTAVTEGFNAQRPWVQVDGDTLFVSYDVGREAQGILDLQCLISVYGRR